MTFISRKFYEPGGIAYYLTDGRCKPLPPNVSHLVNDGRGHAMRQVTWEEVMEQRRKSQEKRLNLIRVEEEPILLPCYVWTFFNAQEIPYHGWYCYVVTTQFDIGVNFKKFHNELAVSIMQAIPLGFLPIKESFDDWMAAFANQFPRQKHHKDKHPKDKRKAGSIIGWLKNRESFTLERP
jgi:hypothetical protein